MDLSPFHSTLVSSERLQFFAQSFDDRSQCDGNKMNVTFTFSRDGKGIGTISFNVAGKGNTAKKDNGARFPKRPFYLTTAFMEEAGNVLDGNGASHMVEKKSAGPTAQWKFIPVPSE